MRISSNVTPTPIVSTPVPQQQPQEAQAQTQAQPSAPAVPPPPEVKTEPMVVDLGGKVIELQPGELAKVIDKVNQTAQVFNRSLQFQIGDSNHIVIKVVDTASGQVLREIPPEKFMDAFKRMEDALGLLLDLKL